MVNGNVSVDHSEHVSTIRLGRPPANLITLGFLQDLHRTLCLVEERSETKCVVITSSKGLPFSCGGDLKESANHNEDEAYAFRLAARQILDQIESCSKPIISAISGDCVAGGASIALTCDIRIASQNAAFSIPDIFGGASPSWSFGMVRLVHYVGRNRALDLLLLGERISAQTAFEMGLVTKVVSEAKFQNEVFAIATRLASSAPKALTAVKECIRCQWWESPQQAALLEERAIQQIRLSVDAHEGMQAAIQNRNPAYVGR